MFQRAQTKLKELSLRLNNLTEVIERDKDKLNVIREQKQQLTFNQNLYLAAIAVKEEAAAINLLGSAIALSAANEARALGGRAGAYVPSEEINSIYGKVVKFENGIEKRKAALASHGLHLDEISSDNLAELLQASSRKKQNLSADESALSEKIKMNERAAELLAREVAECINEVTEPALRFKI